MSAKITTNDSKIATYVLPIVTFIPRSMEILPLVVPMVQSRAYIWHFVLKGQKKKINFRSLMLSKTKGWVDGGGGGGSYALENRFVSLP